MVFEATIGLLVLSGGRRAEIGTSGMLGMQAGPLLFGWMITVSAAVRLIVVALLLRAQRHHDMQILQSVPEPIGNGCRVERLEVPGATERAPRRVHDDVPTTR